jgi:hypothetical protein
MRRRASAVGSDTWKVLAATHLLAAGAGFALAPRELLETDVRSAGFFTTDTRRVLSAAVNGLRSDGTLVVLRVKGTATVSTDRDGFLLLDGHQVMVVPATVSLGVDLSRLSMEDVTYDEATKLVTVRLPPLTMSDVAFEPEGARTIDGGLLSFSQVQVDELSKENYANARRAFTKQVQGAYFVTSARTAAANSVERYFEMPLRAIGREDVRVVATFGGE